MNMMFFCLDTKRELKNQEPNMLPTRTPGHPAFGSGQRAGTELSFAR